MGTRPVNSIHKESAADCGSRTEFETMFHKKVFQ